MPPNATFATDCYGAWSQYRETPLWLRVSKKKHRKRLGDKVLTGTELVPIYLRIGVEFDDVVDSVVDQLRDIAHRIAGIKQN